MEFPFSKKVKPEKSRKGSMPLNVETLMEQERHEKGKMSSLQFRVFCQVMQEKLAAVDSKKPISVKPISAETALEAAKILKQKGGQRHLEVAGMGGIAAPGIQLARGATKGFVDTKGGLGARLAGAGRGAATYTAGDLAAAAVGGGLTGGVLSSARSGVQLHRAKKTVQGFLSTGKRRERRQIERVLKEE